MNVRYITGKTVYHLLPSVVPEERFWEELLWDTVIILLHVYFLIQNYFHQSFQLHSVLKIHLLRKLFPLYTADPPSIVILC